MDVGVVQDSALLPVLLALYLSSIFHILEKKIKKPKNSGFFYFICRQWFICFT